MNLHFEFEKQNKKYLVLENLLYQGCSIEVTHHKNNPNITPIIIYVLIAIFIAIMISLFLYVICRTRKLKNSKIIDYKKEEPSPLYPPSQPYDSTQANTTPMQQQPPYVLQPIPPEVANSDETGYSSGMGQQDGYSSGMGQQGYYSGMAVQPS